MTPVPLVLMLPATEHGPHPSQRKGTSVKLTISGMRARSGTSPAVRTEASFVYGVPEAVPTKGHEI